MTRRCVYFAGGGTGGHIYPGLAVADRLREAEPEVGIHFFVSQRPIDESILSKTGYSFTALPAAGLEASAAGVIRFAGGFAKSYRIAKDVMCGDSGGLVVSTGGFVCAPVVWGAKKFGYRVALINTDSVPGKANRFAARYADYVFLQFEYTKRFFGSGRYTAEVTGCPLREEFCRRQDVDGLWQKLGLDGGKRLLLVTGASSGSASINEAMIGLLGRLGVFADRWQVVHLAGGRDAESVRRAYGECAVKAVVLEYCDEMAALLQGADAVLGRSGAVSVAEYAAAGVAAVCVPYPYHKDRHQYINAEQLTGVGAAVIAEDVNNLQDRADLLWQRLSEIMADDERRERMRLACGHLARVDAAEIIAGRLLEMLG